MSIPRTGKRAPTNVPHSHDLKAYHAAVIEPLIAKIAALEAPPAEPPPVEPPPVEPSPGLKVVTFPLTGTAEQFQRLVADLSIDVIEIAGGTYPKWACFLGAFGINSARPADRRLLVRPARNAHVVWDGTGTVNAPPWRIGWNALTSNIRFETLGTGGSFTAQNYRLGKIGVVTARYVEHVAFHDLTIRGCEGGYGDGIPGAQQHTHALYLGTDGTHRSKDWRSDDWTVEGPANRMLNGIHVYGNPSVDGVEAYGWKVSNVNRPAFLWGDSTETVLGGWKITDCNVTIDNYPNTAQGIVRNCIARNAGPIRPGAGQWKAGPLVDGGGNAEGLDR